MEWVETTAKTIDEAKERALDQLGVADDDAEFEVLEEPKAGLFGLVRGEARVRARVRPTEVRPKVERRRGRRSEAAGEKGSKGSTGTVQTTESTDGVSDDEDTADDENPDETTDAAPEAPGRSRSGGQSGNGRRSSSDDGRGDGRSGGGRSDRGGGRSRDARSEARDDDDREPVEPAVVGAAAVTFMEGIVEAFELEATVELDVDGTELDVRVVGDDLGLLIGPGGRTLSAIQDLARVAAQRRLGDHETRLRIDVAGYRVRRREALERFARTVADQVLESSSARSLEPMSSADRKVIHDVLVEIDGVTSHSEGDDPYRRVVVTPE